MSDEGGVMPSDVAQDATAQEVIRLSLADEQSEPSLILHKSCLLQSFLGS